MATVTALKFSTVEGAEDALEQIKALKRHHLIKVLDFAIVTWPVGEKAPRTKQAVDLVATSTVSGTFWGMLFGMIFAVPLLGMAAGAAIGAVGGSFADYGIDDDFIKGVRSHVTEGTSALFLMTSEAVMDRVVDAMKTFQFEIIATNLSSEQEQKLRAAFSNT